MNLRPYQAEAVAAVLEQWKAVRSTLVVMPTGTGKTVLFSHVIHQTPGMVLVVAHREELIFQAARSIEKITGEAVAIEMAAMRADTSTLRRCRIVVASKDTLVAGSGERRRMHKWKPDAFSVVITDECFPAGTLIDGRPIETIRVGDFVQCFDHKTSSVVFRRVTRIFCNTAHHLVRFSVGGQSVVCTSGHPIFTDRGYIPAASLTTSDHVYQLQNVRSPVQGSIQTRVGPNPQAVPGLLLSQVQACGDSISLQASRDALPSVRNERSLFRTIGVGMGSQGKSVLLGRLQAGVGASHFKYHNGFDKSPVRVVSHEVEKPNECRLFSYKDAGEAERAHVSVEGRKREADRSAASTGVCFGPSDGVRDFNEGRAIAVSLSSGQLQGGHRRPERQSGNRSGWQLAQNETLAISGSPQNQSLERTRVDSVEVLESGRDGQFGGVCADGKVYNIEVEEHHNYFASGVLVHNCHHSTSPTYRAIYDHFSSAKLLGVTATPDRADEIGLKQVFETVAYDYEIIDAVHDGWLVPVIQKSVVVKGLDYSEARTTAGDLNAGDVSRILSREDTLHQFAAATVEIAGDKKTIVFAPPGFSKGDDPFRVSERLTEIINRHKPESARLVWQDTEKHDRRQILQDFKAGRFQFLVNVGVFTEGFDEPGIEVVSMVRPTKSRALYAQMLGRGTRPLPGVVDGISSVPGRVRAISQSAKPSVLVIDFVGNSGRHKLVTPSDILGGKYDDRVLAKARKIAEKTGGSVMGAIEEAQTKVREEDEVQKQREEERRKHAKARAKYVDQYVDPFNQYDRDAPRNEQLWSRSGPATEKQINLLRKWGIDATRMNKVEASRAIGDRIQKFHARKAATS